MMTGSDAAYTVRVRDGGWIWHGGAVYDYYTASNGIIYAATSTDIYEMYSGSATGGTIVSKMFGGQLEGKTVRVNVDVEGDSTVSVTVNGTKQSDSSAHLDATGETGRRINRYSIPRLKNPYVELSMTVNAGMKVHGYWLEVEK